MQHNAAKLLATMGRLAFADGSIDQLRVLDCLVSAAVGDDDPAAGQSVSHSVALDLNGAIDPARRGRRAWPARDAETAWAIARVRPIFVTSGRP